MARSFVAVALILAAGCHGEPVTAQTPSDAGEDTAPVDDTASPTDAGEDAPASDGGTMVDSGVCGVHPGPRMVQLATSDGTFCIDTTEVSNAQYAEFSASTSKPSMPTYCKFKTNYSVANPTPSAKDLPVVNIDWCDAHQYCAWAGKRLCGGMAGGHVVRSGTTISDFVDDSQWTHACENNAGTAYSTGAAFPGGDAGVCNITSNAGMLWSVSSDTGCKGETPPFNEILNLTGNAGEWEDNCNNYDETPDAASSASAICFVRGGTPSTCCVNDFDYKCRAANIITSRNTRSPKIGFRCCSK